MKLWRYGIFLAIAQLISCGDSYNSRMFEGNKGFTENLQSCKPGCYGIPQEWYDLGIIVDVDGNPLSKADPEVKKRGECFFKVCNDPSSSYTKDAIDWVNRFGGEVIYDDSNIVKCDELKSVQSIMFNNLNETSESTNINFDKAPGC
jgi:hypothetical protein